MIKGRYTRDQAVSIVGVGAIDKLDRMHCEPTDRVQTDGDDRVEFASAIECVGVNGEDYTVIAYYYQDEADLVDVECLGDLDWTLTGYGIV